MQGTLFAWLGEKRKGFPAGLNSSTHPHLSLFNLTSVVLDELEILPLHEECGPFKQRLLSPFKATPGAHCSVVSNL